MVEKEKGKMENKKIISIPKSKKEAPLFAWPWQNFNNFKYLLYGPLVAKVVYAIYKKEITKSGIWCLHIVVLFGFRGLVHQLWSTYSNMLFLNRSHRINQQGVEFDQIDAEWHWYHSLHHMDMKTNFCLFMPLYDKLWNTVNTNSWDLHKQISSRTNSRGPDFVFLVHGVDVMSSMHAPFVFRSFSSIPFSMKLFLLPMWHYTLIVMLVMWAKSKTFLFSFYNLRGRLHQTCVVPRFGFQYFLPFAAEGINNHIEDAILKADKIGVKVLSLAALNKNEGLNGGGTRFTEKHPNLRVRVVHGNTLTAGVILNEIPRDVNEVFLSGATSKLGRAIALYLAQRKVKVLMLTPSHERFLKIQKEAPMDCQKYLVQVTKYEAAKNCKTWIIGKWTAPRQQYYAPSGTHFHQFVVPPIIPFRRDCTYGKLAAMELPDDVEGLGSCEYTMGRGVVHACHAGGAVHLLEGWKHHEVGAVNVDQIDVVWKAALRHGFKPM